MILLVPRFGSGRFGRAIDRLFHPRPFKVRLDELGSFVWLRCDGSASVSDLVGAMREHFGERAEPAEDRLVAFLERLLRGRFIRVALPGSTPSRA